MLQQPNCISEFLHDQAAGLHVMIHSDRLKIDVLDQFADWFEI